MKDRLKGVIAVIVVILTVFAWFVTVHGVGSIDAIASKIQRGLDIEGGVYVVLEAQDTEGMTEAELQEAMEQTQAVIENRVDQLGLSNPVVSIEGTDRIRVELPGMENAEEAIALIGQTAQLQFCLADGTFILDGGNVKNASISTSSSYTGYVVKLEFDSEGTQAFTAATEITASGGVSATLTDSSGTLVQDNAIVIMLDDEVISAPVATSVINQSTCIIEGSFTQSTATNLAALIRGGALPIQLEEISSGSQTATIGLNAFENSLVAGIIGLIIIFLLMIFFYRIMGLAADLALALYVVLILMLMAAMGSVLTLPGIAGIILSVGMAVDANVIIFNRIKEEIAVGKTIRVAVQTGYKRALGTVLDSQITTLIATVILYQLGTSAVKGFAWTLMIGILVDIFTAVFITQLFLSLFASSKRFATNKWFAMKEDGTPMFALKWRLQVIKNRKICYLISTAIIVVGLLITATIGLNQGIDFTGGTMLHVDMHTQVAAEDVKDVAAAQGINVDQMEIVFTGTDNEEIIIKTNETLVNEEREQLISALEDTFGITEEDVLESEYFGPSVGKELTSNALKALFFAAVGMLIYIRIRFREWRFGAAALIGVLHDCLILMAFYAIFRVTVNNPFIAAILTVVGYSVNDTIVIFDRIRENGRLQKNLSGEALIDDSLNQTLSRSLMTSITTLVVMIPLLILGGDSIREFVLPLMVGVITGCYSSIFLCSPLYYDMTAGKRRSRYEKQTAAARKASKRRSSKKVKKVETLEQEPFVEAQVKESGEEVKTLQEPVASQEENIPAGEKTVDPGTETNSAKNKNTSAARSTSKGKNQRQKTSRKKRK